MRIFAILAALLLAGCGGGGGDKNPPPPPQQSPAGLWVGSTGDNRKVSCLVFADNAVWCSYSYVDDPGFTEGFVQGVGSVSGNTFTANNGRDFNLADNAVFAGSVSATFTPRQSFSGTVYPGGTTFSLVYDARFDSTPNLAAVAGTYGGQAAAIPGYGIEGAGAAIASNGTIYFASTFDGVNFCNALGALFPRSDGNAYNTGITFGEGCANQGQTYTGVSFLDASGKQLTTLIVDNNRTTGGIFIGVK